MVRPFFTFSCWTEALQKWSQWITITLWCVTSPDTPRCELAAHHICWGFSGICVNKYCLLVRGTAGIQLNMEFMCMLCEISEYLHHSFDRKIGWMTDSLTKELNLHNSILWLLWQLQITSPGDYSSIWTRARYIRKNANGNMLANFILWLNQIFFGRKPLYYPRLKGQCVAVGGSKLDLDLGYINSLWEKGIHIAVVSLSCLNPDNRVIMCDWLVSQKNVAAHFVCGKPESVIIQVNAAEWRGSRGRALWKSRWCLRAWTHCVWGLISTGRMLITVE